MPLFTVFSNRKKWEADALKTVRSLGRKSLRRKIRIVWSDKMYQFVKINFSTKGHRSWPKLTPAYAKRKGSRGAGLLRLTDRMFGSVTSRGGGNITRMQRRGFGMEYTFATTEEKAFWHHHGKGRNPVRKVIDITRTQENTLQREAGKVIQRHLIRQPLFDRIKTPAFKVISPMTGEAVE